MARSVETLSEDRPARLVSLKQERPESTRASRASGVRTPNRGFTAARKATRPSTKSGGNDATFKVPENKKKVIAFLEPENFDAMYRHWVPFTKDDGETVKIPEPCVLDLYDEGCPLCDTGDEPQIVYLFNVADVADPGRVYLWEASPEPYKRIEKLYEELQSLRVPLELDSDGVYAVVSRHKPKRYWEYEVKYVKERDLTEDYDLDPLTPEQLAAMKEHLFTSDSLKFKTYDEMRELAASLKD